MVRSLFRVASSIKAPPPYNCNYELIVLGPRDRYWFVVMLRLITAHSKYFSKHLRQGVTYSARFSDTSNNATQDNKSEQKHPDAEKDPLSVWPGGVNPHTGERGGPAGPEPTRYGDWERKGRVSDF